MDKMQFPSRNSAWKGEIHERIKFSKECDRTAWESEGQFHFRKGRFCKGFTGEVRLTHRMSKKVNFTWVQEYGRSGSYKPKAVSHIPRNVKPNLASDTRTDNLMQVFPWHYS